MVVSGYVAWKRRAKRRQEDGEELYRSAASSLQTRTRRKLTDKEDWYKGKNRKRKRDEFDKEERRGKRKVEEPEEQKKDKTVSVMFVPYTKGGELARRLRLAEEDLMKQTGVKIKIVERTGRRIVDLLFKADPW